jgi:hypothetical protein
METIDTTFTWRGNPDRPRPIDRAREPEDMLVPVFSIFPPDPFTLEVRMRHNNSMTLLPLPALRLEAEVRYEGFSSGMFSLDLERYGGRSITVALKEK